MFTNELFGFVYKAKGVFCPFILICYFLGVWYLNAERGRNIQLHFQHFDLENIDDVVEIRDSGGVDSLFLGKYDLSHHLIKHISLKSAALFSISVLLRKTTQLSHESL